MKRANKNSKLALILSGVAVTGSLSAQTINSTPGAAAITTITQQVETGPILDVVPYVLADGYTINLALIPSLTDFNGYDTLPVTLGMVGGVS